jgi:Transposase DDE domain
MIHRQSRKCPPDITDLKDRSPISEPLPRESFYLMWIITNRNDVAVATELLVSLKQWDNKLLLDDAAYDSKKVRQTAEQAGILLISPINRRNSEERKDAYGRVLSVFLKTRFGQWLFGLRREIERVFNELKSDGLEQPRWYGFHRYVLHVLCCVLMHNFEFLL